MNQIGLFVLVLWSASAVLAQNDAKCGTKGPPPPSSLLGIRNGTDARPNEFPWMAYLQYLRPDGMAGSCGASILNSQWALTAAHCVWDDSTNQSLPEANFYFYGGLHHLSADLDPTVVIRSVNKIIVHESYNHSIKIFDNDIALLKLNETLDLDLKQLGSICLPEKQDLDLIADHHCIATGWGSINSYVNSTAPKVLQKLTSNVWRQKSCKILGQTVNDHHLCWGKPDEGTCAGDSGGPLSCFVDGKWYEYGVASVVTGFHGEQCEFSVFERTSEYSKWIWEKIQTN